MALRTAESRMRFPTGLKPGTPAQDHWWQPVGREISYDASQGRTRTVVVREIRV
ncbi:hypothetical protein [Streptomyces sp. JNUCC 63]